MDKLAFFDLAFEDNVPEIAEEFTKFFYVNNLIPLFTNEHRTGSITVGLIDAQSVVKKGGKAHTLLKEFANWLSLGTDNKSYERAVFKILNESRTWPGFLKQIRDHLNYLPYIDGNYKDNTWNIVFYDKDKSGTKVSKGI